jgi:hypothetical protein
LHERLAEFLVQARRIRLCAVEERRGRVELELVLREDRADVALERVDEADARDHVADLGDLLDWCSTA